MPSPFKDSHIPLEVIHCVCELLVPGVVPTRAAIPVQRTPRSKEIQVEYSALYSLTLVSHRLSGVAKIYLYRNLIITTPQEMVCLLRTLHGNPNLCRYPRYLANLVDLMDVTMQAPTIAAIQRHFPGLRDIVMDPARRYPPELKGRKNRRLRSAQPLWTHEMLRTLHILVTVLPSNKAVPEELTQSPDIAFLPPSADLPAGFDNPRTLRVQHGGNGHAIVGHLDQFQLYFTPYVENGCLVTDLRFLSLGNIQGYESKGHFSISFDSYDPANVQEALEPVAASLKKLHLRVNSTGPISFLDFHSLETLIIGHEVVTEKIGFNWMLPLVIIPRMPNLTLASLLPRTLTSLTLINETVVHPNPALDDHVWHYNDAGEKFVADSEKLLQAWLSAGLKAFSQTCQTLPNLKTVTVIQPFGRKPKLQGPYPIHLKLGDMDGFNAAGVCFSVEVVIFNRTFGEDFEWGP
ncbi:hypothetical protein EKO27_g8501 [Xylaria grammica]|uniref:Uncharacterized protein n=1 Tax=Xylaria grammica TaxID=363999 RepID=A0A439CX53_9PEZI|nr:hypothetical protein EKO27_g8501 [Xylaria grammica]